MEVVNTMKSLNTYQHTKDMFCAVTTYNEHKAEMLALSCKMEIPNLKAGS